MLPAFSRLPGRELAAAAATDIFPLHARLQRALLTVFSRVQAPLLAGAPAER